MTRNSLALRLAGFLAAAILAAPNANAASTYSTYSGDDTRSAKAGGVFTNCQYFRLNADWLFKTEGDALAASATALSLDSITVHWPSASHANATIGGTGETQPDAYLVVTSPLDVIVGISAVNDAKWTASGTSTFAFSGLVLAANVQYRYYFVTSVDGLQVGATLASSVNARVEAVYHGTREANTSDSIVRCGASDTYSIHSDFAVSAADEASSYTATVSSDKVWSAIEWDGGKTWNDATSSAVVTLAIDEGATVTAPANLNVAALLVSGDGTLTFAEGENAVSSYAVVSAKVSVPSGATLKTSGDVLLSSTANEIAPGGTLEVVSGVTRADTYTDENWSGGFKGTLTIDSGAKFVNLHSSDALAFNPDAATPVNVNVAGTLDMGTTRWTLSNNVFVNMQGGTVTGTGDGTNGALDFIGTSALSASADSTISASVRIRAQSVDVTVADGATLTLSGPIYNEPSNQNAASAGIAKKGAGTLVVSGAAVTLPVGVGIDAGVVRLGGGAAGLSVSVPNGGGTLEAVSGATLTGTATFAGHIPSDANKSLLGSASWTGMVVIDGLTQGNTDLTGLGGRVTLKNYSGYLDKTKSTSSLALTVTGTFTQTNGWSTDNDKVSLASLSGDATMGDEYNLSSGANPAQLFSIPDISSFTGRFDFDHCRVTTTGDFTLDKEQKVATLTVGGTLAVSGGSLTGNLVANNVTVTAESDVAVGDLLVGVSGTTTVSGAVTLNGNAVAYEIKDGGLYRAEPTVTITVPAVANATATVTVEGVAVEPTDSGANTYSVVAGSTVTVAYAANDGYALSGTATYTIDNAAEGATITITDTATAQYVAQAPGANGAKYTSLAAGFADSTLSAVGPLKLLADVTLSDTLTVTVPASGSGLNFNGFTLTGNLALAKEGESENSVFFALNGSKLVGNLSVGSGVILFPNSAEVEGDVSFSDGGLYGVFNVASAAFSVDGAVNISGALTLAGTITTVDDGRYKVISGTTITLAEGATIVNAENPYWTAEVVDGDGVQTLEISAAVASVDGTLYSSVSEAVAAAKEGDSALTLLDNAGTVTLFDGDTLKVKKGDYAITVETAEGYYVSESDADDDGVVTYAVYKYAVKRTRHFGNGPESDYFTTLADAAAAVAGENPPVSMTLELLGDAKLDETLALSAPSGYGLTLDLGGYTLTGPADGYAISNSGRLTISNGSISAGGIVENTASGASATIQSGTYSASGESAFSAVDGSTITVKRNVVFTSDIDASYCETGYTTRAVTDADGVTTYVVSVDKGWIYEDKDYSGYTGTWTTEVEYDDNGRAAIEDSNTYTPSKASAGELVTVSLTMSFDAERDDEDALEPGAQAGIRLGPDSTFQVYTLVDADGTETAKWLDVAAGGVTPATETDYTFKFTLDYTAKTYTVAVVDGETERALASGETTAFKLADQTKDKVTSLEFDGSGTVTSITGSYEDAEVPTEEFDAGDVEGEDGAITLTADQAAWLNSYGDYAAVKAAIAGLDAKTFNDAYLLNLDVTGEFSYEFDVTDIEVGDTTVKVTATLTRTGARTADGAALPINGTLKLLGSAELAPDTFTEQGTAEVDDGKMSSGSATLTFPIPDENPPTFFTATIE